MFNMNARTKGPPPPRKSYTFGPVHYILLKLLLNPVQVTSRSTALFPIISPLIYDHPNKSYPYKPKSDQRPWYLTPPIKRRENVIMAMTALQCGQR